MLKRLSTCLTILAMQLAFVACSGESATETVVDNGGSAGNVICFTEPLDDGSGLKVLCGDDSVAVIRNGADGKPGTDGKPGASCTVAETPVSLNLKCGNQTIVIPLDRGDSGNVNLDSEQIALNLEGIGGFSQKGPFLLGSSVEAFAIDNGRDLNLVGSVFQGTIKNDKGEFDIRTVRLPSQYAILQATGSYRNEVSGSTSDNQITLSALTDLSIRSTANINLMTHLERERASRLVVKEGMKVSAAKTKAEEEIFAAFGIDSKAFKGFSEDLNVGGTSDADGALLAVTVMLQGDRKVSELSELLTRISEDMKLDGTWDNLEDRAAIADWAMTADMGHRLQEIREHVASWKISDRVADFEKHIRNYWSEELGLGKCGGDGSAVGTIVFVDNEKSSFYARTFADTAKSKVRFTCVDSTGIGKVWRLSTDREMDSYGWADSTDGAIKEGIITKKKYVFDSTGAKDGVKGWREAELVEEIFGGCREAMYDSIVSRIIYSDYGPYEKFAEFNICQESSHVWTLIVDDVLVDTQHWADGVDGDARRGDSVGVVDDRTRNCYVWDDAEEYGGWRKDESHALGETACDLEIGGCTVKRLGTVAKVTEGTYYECQRSIVGWSSEVGDVYGTVWLESLEEEYEIYVNTYLYRCTLDGEGEGVYKDGDLVNGIERKSTKYACDNGKWRNTETVEELVGVACTESLQGLIIGGETTCDNHKWRPTIFYDYDVSEKDKWFNPNLTYGDLEDKRDGRHYKTIQIGEFEWMAENLNYADSTSSGCPYLKGNNKCYNNDSTNCLKGGRYYTWTAAMCIDPKWQRDYTIFDEENVQGICPEGWHVPEYEEWTELRDNAPVDESIEAYWSLLVTGVSDWSHATNESGFTALPSKFVFSSSDFRNVSDAFFWSATSDLAEATRASAPHMDGEGFDFFVEFKSNFHPVRCVRTIPETN